MKYKAVIFDLDGTLLDTIEDLANCMNTVLSQSGLPRHDINAYKYFVGNGIRNLVKRALPEFVRNDADVDTYTTAMLEEYAQRWDEKTKPYEGIPQLLDGLQKNNVKMTVLSNKADKFAKLVVQKFLSRWNFDVVFGERPEVARKPDPAAALMIADLLEVPPQEFLYLGDSGVDMETANRAGMFAVGALWGFRDEEELHINGAKIVIKHPVELLTLL